jgi:hypothetical protein
MREKKFELRKTVFAFLAIAYALLEIYLKENQILINEIFRIVAVAAFLYVWEDSISVREDAVKNLSWRNEFLSKNRRKVAGSLLTNFDREVERSPKVEDDRLIMEPSWLAKQSYEIFWEILIERNNLLHDRLSVHIVHSSEIEVWSQHPQLLRLQGKFCAEQGKITRIICGKDPAPSKSEISTANEMKKAGIEVYYYHMNPDHMLSFNYDFSWDFAFVVNTEDVCVWDTHRNPAFQSDNKIKRAEYFSGIKYRNQDLRKIFAQIRQAATEIPSSAASLSSSG